VRLKSAIFPYFCRFYLAPLDRGLACVYAYSICRQWIPVYCIHKYVDTQ